MTPPSEEEVVIAVEWASPWKLPGSALRACRDCGVPLAVSSADLRRSSIYVFSCEPCAARTSPDARPQVTSEVLRDLYRAGFSEAGVAEVIEIVTRPLSESSLRKRSPG